MRSETEIKKMLEKLKAFQKIKPIYGKVDIAHTQVQIDMLEYVLEIRTGDLLQATKDYEVIGNIYENKSLLESED